MINFQMGSADKWVFVFILGLILFNWPVLSIFDVTLPHYLFGLWAVFILIVGIMADYMSGKAQR